MSGKVPWVARVDCRVALIKDRLMHPAEHEDGCRQDDEERKQLVHDYGQQVNRLQSVFKLGDLSISGKKQGQETEEEDEEEEGYNFFYPVVLYHNGEVQFPFWQLKDSRYGGSCCATMGCCTCN